jgi:hypothetical protein
MEDAWPIVNVPKQNIASQVVVISALQQGPGNCANPAEAGAGGVALFELDDQGIDRAVVARGQSGRLAGHPADVRTYAPKAEQAAQIAA